MGDDGSPAVVRVCSANGAAMGAGFLVTPNLVLTCAHVLDGIDGPIRLEFPLLPRGDGSPVPFVTAEVLSIRPPQNDDSGDTALLVIRTPLPPGAEAVPLAASSGQWDDEVRIFGFPQPFEHGVWVSGRLKSWQGAGWKQMESQPGYPAIAPGFSGSPVWSSRLNAVIGMTVATHNSPDATTAYLVPVERLASAHPELAARPPGRPPYRGLEPFLEEHADIFHGRAAAIRRLADAVESRPVVVLSGPSGSGKSSLVLAGLIPTLRMTVVRFRPDPVLRPSTMLASVLVPVLEPGLSEVDLLVEKEKLAARLSSPDMVALLARRLAERCPDGLLIFADQFEEIAASDPESARTLLNLLISLVATGPLHAVLTLRSASLDELLTSDTASTLDQGTMLLAPMSRDELYAAVTGPVTADAFEPGLVGRVLDDGRGRLPLVQFALTLLWEASKGGLLTHADYDNLGGVSGALVSYAERVYQQNLSPAEQTGARRLFVQLARPEEDGSFSRRSARVAELDPELRPVVARLVAARLVVADHAVDGEEIVDIVHQALIQQWERLHTWLVDDREFRSWQEQLRQRQELGHDDGSLLRGSALSKAQYWLAERGPDIPATQQKFIQNSGFRQRREVRVLRVVVAAIVVLLLVAGVLGTVAWQSNLDNQRQLHTQASHLLGQEAARQLPDNPLTSLQLALSAWKNDNATAESYEALLRSRLAMGAVTGIQHNLLDGDLEKWSASRDGSVVATVLRKPGGLTATVWTGFAEGRPMRRELPDVAEVANLAVSPDGMWLALSEIKGGIRLRGLSEHNDQVVVLADSDSVKINLAAELVFSADSTRIMAYGGDVPHVWEINGRKVGTVGQSDDPWEFRQLAFGKDPRTFVAETNKSDAVTVSDYETGSKLLDLPKFTRIVRRGAVAVACGGDGVEVLDTGTGALLWSLHPVNLGCSRVRDDITGRYVTFADSSQPGDDGFQTISVIDPDSGQTHVVAVPQGLRDAAPFLVTPGENGSVTVLAVLGRSVLTLTAVRTGPFDAKPTSVSPDGSLTLHTGDGPATIEVHIDRGPLGRQLGGPSTSTADGRRFVATLNYSDLAVYSLPGFAEERRIALPPPILKCFENKEFVWVIAPGPDEAVVICGTTLLQWDMRSGDTTEGQLPVTGSLVDVLSRPGHPDELVFVTARSVEIWDMRAQPVLVRAIKVRGAMEDVIAIDQRGALLALGATGQELDVWDLDRGTPVATRLPIDQRDTNFVKFGRDDLLLTVREASLLSIWDVRKQKLWATAKLPWAWPLDVHEDALRFKGKISVPLDPAQWYADLCRWAHWELTPEERRLVPVGAKDEPACS